MGNRLEPPLSDRVIGRSYDGDLSAERLQDCPARPTKLDKIKSFRVEVHVGGLGSVAFSTSVCHNGWLPSLMWRSNEVGRQRETPIVFASSPPDWPSTQMGLCFPTSQIVDLASGCSKQLPAIRHAQVDRPPLLTFVSFQERSYSVDGVARLTASPNLPVFGPDH